ncbi:hypothetical protein ACTDI5_07060 [Bacillus paralicheniformis]|uniref:hypothetical protein n=1 Tax=Bacillus paralicheniformis TaxID=1648923 RepID=UPI003F78F176
MRLKFEEWLNEQNINQEAYELFVEGIDCYKIGSYRGALLLSFLGFQNILRERILTSKEPQNYTASEWGAFQKDFNDPDTWDKKVINTVQMKTKPVFKINNDVYAQYFYWKDRRNDCAHAKGNMISAPHVEAFWLFVKSNLYNFRVNGGAVHLIQAIKDHYDPLITSPNLDITPLVSQIPYIIELKDYNDFLNELLDITTTKDSRGKLKGLTSKGGEVWGKLFELGEDRYNNVLINFLIKTDNEFFTTLLLYSSPHLIKFFYNKKSFIRKKWKGFSREIDYPIFIEMIRNDLIDEEDKYEVYEHMFDNVASNYFDDDFVFYDKGQVELDKIILQNEKFFTFFYEKAFKEGKIHRGYEWGNRNRHLVVFYIKEYGLDKVIVDSLYDAQNRSYPPLYLNSEIERLFKVEESLKNKYEEIYYDLYGESTS